MRKKSYVLVIVACVFTVRAMVSMPGAWAADTFKVLHPFTWAKGPNGTLLIDASGNIYGTTESGGGSGCGGGGCGAVWKLKPNPNGIWTVSILHVFSGVDGATPYLAGLAFDRNGNLYSTTYNGGAHTFGVVFKLKPNPDGSWTEDVLYSFTGGTDGRSPYGSLIFDTAGNLYGTTYAGGTDNFGVVFKLKPNPDGTWTESVLHSFTGGDGSYPDGLIFDTAGSLYGAAYAGGTDNFGVVFKLKPNPDGTWTESVLHSFTGVGSDGGFPFAGPIFDAAGNLYGTTQSGAPVGAVFQLAPNPDGTWTETTLANIGGNLNAGLAFDAKGNLYGSTYADGINNFGAVFRLKPNPDGTWTETVLHSFVGYGKYPEASVIFDSAGNLYGTTSNGSTNSGIVFEITP